MRFDPGSLLGLHLKDTQVLQGLLGRVYDKIFVFKNPVKVIS